MWKGERKQNGARARERERERERGGGRRREREGGRKGGGRERGGRYWSHKAILPLKYSTPLDFLPT